MASEPRRLAVVLARHSSVAPPGIDARAYARAGLADTYEVLADLAEVRAGLVGDVTTDDLLWPGDLHVVDRPTGPLPSGASTHWTLHAIAQAVTELRQDDRRVAVDGETAGVVDRAYDELVIVPADVPDLPGLVIAKLFKALQRADVCWAPERVRDGEGGGAAVAVRLPWPAWVPDDLDLDVDEHPRLVSLAPRRSLVARGPDWHRLRTAGAVSRLDPGLEGWEMTRALLSGHALAE